MSAIRKLIILLLIVTFCEASSKGQAAQSVKLIERLPNGEHIVEIDGAQYRTISADHARQIEQRKAELEKTQRERDLLIEEVELLKRQNQLLTKDAQLADAKAKLERERADKFKLLYEGEQNLRLQSEKLTHKGWAAKLLDNSIVKFGFDIGLPVFQTWYFNRRRQ